MNHLSRSSLRLVFTLVMVLFSIFAISRAKYSPVQDAYAIGNSGSIWTTNLGCAGQQDVNIYSVGETVSIHGENFASNSTHAWTITGQPGNASSNPGQVVASGSVTTDGNGDFCVSPAYTIPQSNWGEFTVDVTDAKKNDNYRVSIVESSPSPSPSPTPSVSPSPSPTPSVSPSPSPSVVPAPSPSSSPSPSVAPSPSPSVSPDPTAAPSPSPSEGPAASPSPTPSAVPAPSPSSSPSPGNSSSLGKDGPVCGNGAFKATMDLRDSNNNPVSGIQVIFTYRGEQRTTTSNQNGRGETTYSFSAEDSVYASANGFPSQALFVSAPQNCPPGVGGTSTSNGSVLGASTSTTTAKKGSVLGASTLANTGTDYASLFYYGAAVGLSLIGGTGILATRRK